jgi:RNA polymerase sigma-70 factor (ECF subfamily)
MPADEAIIQLVQAGRRQEALERLVPAYRRRVFGLAFSILRDRAAAEDLAQEVFVKLWKALPGYDGRAQLSTWIYAITRNAAVSALRSRRRTLSMSDPAVVAEAEGVAAAAASAPEDAGLRRQVEALPVRQRQAVTLYYLDERPVSEVAEMMGLPVNTVKTHLHRARASLARALGVEAGDFA